ncbi:MAG: hypothetical protein GW939_02080 [Candidatus Magasanikbacteria bacterium]|nr:hypothetical protein [Candidatus Magasanikbacteria bacterium]NCS72357.1 hypothetical protein [Candidatus Magasanikbacteria bacterium]
MPKSRIPYEHRGSKGHENIRKVVRWRHEAWHNVFGNKTPIEVVDMLWRLAPAGYFETFDVSMSWWGQRVSLSLESHEQTEFMADWGDKKFLAWKALFGSRSLVLVLAEVLREWAPDGYFTRYSIVAYDSGAWYKVRHF